MRTNVRLPELSRGCINFFFNPHTRKYARTNIAVYRGSALPKNINMYTLVTNIDLEMQLYKCMYRKGHMMGFWEKHNMQYVSFFKSNHCCVYLFFLNVTNVLFTKQDINVWFPGNSNSLYDGKLPWQFNWNTKCPNWAFWYPISMAYTKLTCKVTGFEKGSIPGF